MSEKARKSKKLLDAVLAEQRRTELLFKAISRNVATEQSPNESTLNDIEDSIENHRNIRAFAQTNSDVIDDELVRAVSNYAAKTIEFYEETQELNFLHGANRGRAESSKHITKNVMPAIEAFKEAQATLSRTLDTHQPGR